MTSKPILLYSRPGGPNPWKVALILEELGLNYKRQTVPASQIKSEPFISVNPNGRVPAIEDPNTGITLWESNAIIEYLVDQYDKDNKISFSTLPEKYLLKQWATFQVSGQGPYYGQAAWFKRFHSESLPSAKTRYLNEVKRVVGVLDKYLEGKEWLVGNKCTYADLVFVNWDSMIPFIFMKGDGDDVPDEFDIKEYPNFKRWHESMTSRPSFTKTMADKQADQEAEKAGN